MLGTIQRFGAAFRRAFPERRIYLRSDAETRFVRLSPATQVAALVGGASFVAWAVFATAILLMDTISSGSLREQTAREQRLYAARMNMLSEQRDKHAVEALQAQERFTAALDRISVMQSEYLVSENRRRELETGIEAVQSTLRRAVKERDAAREEVESLTARLGGANLDSEGVPEDIQVTLDFLTSALHAAAEERDKMADVASEAEAEVSEMELERRLIEERNDRIFAQLEDAVSLSMEPLDKMFRAVGLSPSAIIETIRRGYSGQGGPLTPLSFSTKGQEEQDGDSLRANSILEKMDRMNLYRLAVEKTPFMMPLKSSFRFTSGFGPRWGRMHIGADFAAAHGTPIYATADGVVTYSGWLAGYGRLVKVQHEFGMETRYAHLSRSRVKVGQRVSRGEQIGDMGNTGRSTGTHLHYEVRVRGKPADPMTYIKAARDVF